MQKHLPLLYLNCDSRPFSLPFLVTSLRFRVYNCIFHVCANYRNFCGISLKRSSICYLAQKSVSTITDIHLGCKCWLPFRVLLFPQAQRYFSEFLGVPEFAIYVSVTAKMYLYIKRCRNEIEAGSKRLNSGKERLNSIFLETWTIHFLWSLLSAKQETHNSILQKTNKKIYLSSGWKSRKKYVSF